jgi:hypothetical protein
MSLSLSASATRAAAPVATQRAMHSGIKQHKQASSRAALRNRAQKQTRRATGLKVQAIKDGAPLDRPLRVAVIGGGPSGACAAETLAKGGVETFLFERKLDNCKVRHTPGPPGAPCLCMRALAGVAGPHPWLFRAHAVLAASGSPWEGSLEVARSSCACISLTPRPARRPHRAAVRRRHPHLHGRRVPDPYGDHRPPCD